MNAADRLPSAPPAHASGVGLLYGLAAYLSWGVFPLYFHLIKAVPAMLVLGHRIVWSVAFLTILLAARRELRAVARCLADRRTLLLLLASTVLIAVNWFTFIWAVGNGQVVEASFGYFINPLVNVALGVALLKERLRIAQLAAIVLAAAGVCLMTWAYGRVPVVSLALAVSFGLYGLVRKVASVGPLIGLAIETYLLLPLALGYVVWQAAQPGGGLLDRGPMIGVLLVLGGVITAGPLIWFAAAARRLKLATLGFLQYVAPTCQLLIAVLVFKEAFTTVKAQSFGLIWLAIVVFSADSVARLRRGKPAAAAAAPEREVTTALPVGAVEAGAK